MNYGCVENPVWSIFISRDVQLKHDCMSLKKENWTPELLVAILLDIRKKFWGFKFYNHSTRGNFETRNAHFFKDIEFDGGGGEIKLETQTFTKNTMIVLIQKEI